MSQNLQLLLLQFRWHLFVLQYSLTDPHDLGYLKKNYGELKLWSKIKVYCSCTTKGEQTNN